MDQDIDETRPRFAADARHARATAEEAVIKVSRGQLADGQVSKGYLRRVFENTVLRVAKAPAPGQTQLPVRLPRKRPSAYLISFLALVAIPSFIAILYLAFVASDQYVSETRFALRSQETAFGSGEKSESGGGHKSSGGLPSLGGQEAYIVTGYIHSRAILDDLAKDVDLRAIYRRPEADFWAKLKAHASAEDFLDYWNGMVTTSVDGPSGIVTVYVRAFRPDDALHVAQAIVKVSEKLINDISLRARNDMVKRAEDEVRDTEGRVRTALADMRVYRDKEGFIDPTIAATSTGKLLIEAMGEKIKLQNDYFATSTSLSPNAPSLQTLKAQLQGINKQIDDLKGQLTSTSTKNKTISAALGRFEELELHRIFAEKLYTMAQDALERAKLKAEEQSIYLTPFVPPDLPEDAKYPERLAMSCLIPIGLLIVWGIFALMAAAVNDHRY